MVDVHDMEARTVAASIADLHREPPATPWTFFSNRRYLLAGIAAVFVTLAAFAAADGGWLLLHWDRPIQTFVEDHRTDTLTTAFLFISRFGSTMVVLSLGALLSVLCWKRCRAVSYALIVATLSRPLLEALVKELVSRDRPAYDRLVDGTGYSFPTGHVMAAVALYGLLPVIVGLFSKSRALWWASAVVSGVMIVAIGASRVYLGVHWFTDVIAGLLVGTFFLIAIEQVLHHAHRTDHCARGGCGSTPCADS
jgi:undecaprenyl-diphosphatase